MARARRSRHSGARIFIEDSCQTTRYPALCIKCLSQYANSNIRNEQQLAQVALTDCLQQIDDSVNQLSQSIRELRRLDPKAGMTDGIFWHIDNVETWVSAALTDASSCVDEFPEHRMSKMKATIKVKVLNVAQLTSNALALFHRYAARYRGAAANKKP
ncbi:hypothetical protein CRYUN_Cryun14cG0019900 [Craigia yunnanensis]